MIDWTDMILYKSLGFSQSEVDVLQSSILALRDGNFIEDPEFHTVMGFDVAELTRVLETWPYLNVGDTDNIRIIKNTLNNLIGYPHEKDELLLSYVGVSKDALDELWTKLDNCM
jgi:hypothetical protein